MFSNTTDFSSVRDIVVGRVLLDNCLMRIMYLSGGELVDITQAVDGVHQGFYGFKRQIKSSNATWSNISWNQKITKFKYINHQGSLLAANRVVPKHSPGTFAFRKPRHVISK